MKRRRPRSRLVGFEYEPLTGIARFSMYVPGTAGRERKRATVEAKSYDEAVQLWTEFRARVKAGNGRPSPEAPSFREFIAGYLPLIAVNVSVKTLRDYRYAIDRHLMPAFGVILYDRDEVRRAIERRKPGESVALLRRGAESEARAASESTRRRVLRTSQSPCPGQPERTRKRATVSALASVLSYKSAA